MKALGLILAGGNNNRMRELSNKRAIAAMPVGGSFRCIDFVLSNMSNSHIQKVAVLTQYNARSLNEHLSSSKWWDFGRKQGGLYVFNPTVTVGNSWWYRGTADAMYQNIDFLKRSHEPYVIITNGDCVYKIDYNEVLDYHIDKKADITVVCKDIRQGEDDISRFGIVRMNENARIVDFEEKPMVTQSNTISTGIYIIRRRALIEMLEKCAQEDRFDFVTDILIRYKNLKHIYGYKIEGYWSNIATVESYYRTNMDFLNKDVRGYFSSAPKIYSKVDDLPPAKYNVGSDVRNSLVSSGCILNSKVENSVLFKNVFVGKNCVIKNSIILNDVYIGDNTHIENCIVESRGTLNANTYYSSEDGVKVVVEHNERYVF
ncbi:MAG: glucose-1-phosphate adenylyltransferase subunit GlgD [Lachnospiraceae bacterium]|nr:glucose-1-phosphate adenylyltransferase subunit GlgD [Lachnospiraceae bacterium]